VPSPSPSSSAQQAREALGIRLREIRLDAGFTARDLGRLMGRHSSKISRIEHGTAAPSPDDIRIWCRHCGAAEQVPDLIASLQAVDGMWIEWRRMERTGLRRAQQSVRPLYERTAQFRTYSPALIPGIVQTRAYTTAVLTMFMRRRNLPDDVAQAVAVRMERQRFLYEGDHRFAVLVEESALRIGVGGTEVMTGQLGHLITVASLPRVSLGIVPDQPDRDAAWPVEGFWMFDDEQVQVELVSGHLTITQPREIAMYAQVFAELAALAVYGAAARARITAAIEALDAAP
jgi:transcriptional regulator with XRE-family HTH domain